jgi:hypothetical protein
MTVVTPSELRSSFQTRNGHPALLRTTLGSIEPADWQTRGPRSSYGPIGFWEEATPTHMPPVLARPAL